MYGFVVSLAINMVQLGFFMHQVSAIAFRDHDTTDLNGQSFWAWAAMPVLMVPLIVWQVSRLKQSWASLPLIVCQAIFGFLVSIPIWSDWKRYPDLHNEPVSPESGIAIVATLAAVVAVATVAFAWKGGKTFTMFANLTSSGAALLMVFGIMSIYRNGGGGVNPLAFSMTVAGGAALLVYGFLNKLWPFLFLTAIMLAMRVVMLAKLVQEDGEKLSPAYPSTLAAAAAYAVVAIAALVAATSKDRCGTWNALACKSWDAVAGSPKTTPPVAGGAPTVASSTTPTVASAIKTE